LMEIQAAISQQSMANVHIIVQQIMYEALQLEKQYCFESSFFHYMVELISNIELELKPFLERQNENWDEHCELVKKLVRDQMKSSRRIKVDGVPRNHPRSAPYVRCVVISKWSQTVQKCSRELEAKTIMSEFTKTKGSLNKARTQLNSLLVP